MSATVPELELRRSSGVLSTVDNPFQLYPLVWDTVKEHLNPSEIDEIRRILGDSAIEANEVLQTEIQALIEIWNEFRKTVDDTLEASTKPRSALPEPPGRELLERKIIMMINRLEQRSAIRDKHIDMDVVPVETPREKEIVDYISVRKQQPSRPKSASPRDGRPPTASPRDPVTGRPLALPPDVQAPVDTRPPTATPRNTSASLPLERLKAKLNVYDIESIKEQLQQSIREEHAMLVDDAEYLRKCIDDEMRYRKEAEEYARKISAKTPSLQDLQEFGAKLEKRFLAEKEQRDARRQQQLERHHQQQQQQQQASALANGAKPEAPAPPLQRRPSTAVRLEPLSPLRQSREAPADSQ